MDTRTLVEKYFVAVNEGDWETWLSLFEENVVMDEQLARHLKGIDVLRGAINVIKKGYSRFQNHPLHIVVEGNRAMALWHIAAANAAGVPIDAKGANYFEAENGKITYMANYHDSVPFKPFTDQKPD